MSESFVVESQDAVPLRLTGDKTDISGDQVMRLSYYVASGSGAGNGPSFWNKTKLAMVVAALEEVRHGNANEKAVVESEDAIPLRLTIDANLSGAPEGAKVRITTYVASGSGAINGFSFFDDDKIDMLAASINELAGL